MKLSKRKQSFYQVAPWILPILILLSWYVLTSTGIIGSDRLPDPLKVLRTLGSLIQNGELATNIGVSGQRAISGFALGGGIGFLLGLINGFSITAEKLLDSTLQMVRNIPLFALIPLFILWFGIDEEAKLLLIAIGVFFPIYLNTFHGIRSIDPNLVEMGKVYGLKGLTLCWHVILPGALPSILVGVRYALGIMWLVLIVAETVAAKSGIGYMANSAREYFQMDVIVLTIIIYALLGKLSDSIAKLLEKWWLQWNPNFAKR